MFAGALAALAFLALGFSPIIYLAAIVVGLVGVALGTASARAADRRSNDWWMGVVGAVLGAVPLLVLAWVIFATAMGWAEWR